MLAWTAAAATAFVASLLSGVAGFGGASLYLPVLVALYGAPSSVPILTVSVLLGNASRAWFFREHIDWRVAALFCLGAAPAAWLGSMIYVRLPAEGIRRAIGLFLVASVVWQKAAGPVRMRRAWLFVPLGAATGLLSALVGAAGPVVAPFFLSYGLAKEAFVGSEALCAALTHLTKSAAYGRFGALSPRDLSLGLSLGLLMIAGSYCAKLVMKRLPRERFLALVETLLVVVGLVMLLKP